MNNKEYTPMGVMFSVGAGSSSVLTLMVSTAPVGFSTASVVVDSMRGVGVRLPEDVLCRVARREIRESSV